MPALHDVACAKCNKIERNHFFPNIARIDRDMPLCCGARMEICWQATNSIHSPCHPSETIVIWEHPQTGQVMYPARNDVPMPARYRSQGYVRREIRNLADVRKFEKEKKVVAECAEFDRGTGRGMEDYETRPRFR